MPSEQMQFSPHEKLMRADEIFQIAKVFVREGVKKIRLTGGEPLVRNDAKQILESLSTLPVELAITTNGYLAGEFKNVLKKCGIHSVNISLDSLDKNLFRQITQRDHFETVFRNILDFTKSGFHVKVNAVLMKGVNDHELEDFIELTRNYPLHIRFIEYMPFSGNKWDAEKVLSHQEALDRISASFDYVKLLDGPHDTAKKFKVIGHEGTFALISTMTEPFCGNCNRLRLTADGKMKNCLFSKGETDLLSALRTGEDILPLIRENVLRKEKERGGQLLNLDQMDKVKSIENRSMVRIGG